MPEVFDAATLIATLRRHGVEYIVVGGVCAVLHGAPLATFALDIVPECSPANLERLTAALIDLDARYRRPAPEPIVPRAQDLAGPGRHPLLTRAGPLDVLGTVADARDFAALASQSEHVHVAGGPLRILTLDALIALKRVSGRAKDRAALELLLALRDGDT